VIGKNPFLPITPSPHHPITCLIIGEIVEIVDPVNLFDLPKVTLIVPETVPKRHTWKTQIAEIGAKNPRSSAFICVPPLTKF
jgi:hypothetical protein